MKGALYIGAFLFAALSALGQEKPQLEEVRQQFQDIDEQKDIEQLLAVEVSRFAEDEQNVILAYQGAARCMLAEYVFSPIAKLDHFKTGKKELEASITVRKEVENVYLRLLIQLSVPGIVNYKGQIGEDLAFLERNLASFPAEEPFKRTMVQNLMTAAKKKEIKQTLLEIERSVAGL